MGMRYFPNIVLWPFVGAYGMHRGEFRLPFFD